MFAMRHCPACGFEHPEGLFVCPTTQHVIGALVLGGRYRVDKLIAVGGIGAVYDARALHIDRRVAIKRLLPMYTSDAEIVRRFQHEARAAGRIAHPNVVEVLDYGLGDDGVPYLVMEFLDGETLASRIERSPGQRISTDEFLPVVLDVLGALDHAHSVGIVHRDMKPENVFLSRLATGVVQVKVVDLGISKALGSASQAITQTGSALGTPHYMAPEQLRGDKDVDGRIDVYAVGIMTYRALSGAFPYDGRTFEHLVARILDATCPPLAVVAPEVPDGVSRAVMWAMSREAADRPPTAAALADALRPFAPAGAPAGLAITPPSTAARPASPAGTPAPGRQPDAGRSSSSGVHDDTTLPRERIEDAVDGSPDTSRTTPLRLGPVPIAGIHSATVPSAAAATTLEPRPRRARWLGVAGTVLLVIAGAAILYLLLREPSPAPRPATTDSGGLIASAGAAPGDRGTTADSTDAAGRPWDGAAGVVDAAGFSPPDGPPATDATPAVPEASPGREAGGGSGPAREDARGGGHDLRPADDVPRPDRAASDPEMDAFSGAAEDAAAAADGPADVVSTDAARPMPDLGAALAAAEDGVRRCARNEGPGSVAVTATIRGSDGRVVASSVDSDLSAQVRQCVRDILHAVPFPMFEADDITITHAFGVPAPPGTGGDDARSDAGSAEDAGALPPRDEIVRRLRTARRHALVCTEGVVGPVALMVTVDGQTRRATLDRVDGNVDDGVRDCLRRVVEAVEVPSFPGSITAPMRL